MAVTYYAILTAVGAAKLANAAALGTTLQITQMAVGDGGGNVPVPDANRTTLVNEVRRAPLNQLKIDPSNSAQIIAEQVIPESVGGWWIREMGLLDNTGALIAIANCAPSYKPQLAEGSGRTQTVRMVLIVNNTGSVELKIDPSVVLATREYCDNAITTAINRQDAKASVRAATTANIALNGLPTVDGVVLAAGDRVLVKNQAAGSQNGIYVAAAGAWARSADADENAEVTPSLTVSVESGTAQADTVWQLITDAPIVVGTTALVFQDITNGLARLASPTFSGSPSAPTPSLFDSSQRLATMEALQRALGNRSTMGTNITGTRNMALADLGGTFVFNGGAGTPTAVLPDIATLAKPGSLYFYNTGSVNAVVQAFAGQVIAKANGLTTPSVSVPPGGSLILSSLVGVGGWFPEGGSVANQFDLGSFGALLANPGWRLLPRGEIENWGTLNLTGVGSFNQETIGGTTFYTNYYNLTYPMAYKVAPFEAEATLACATFASQTGMAGKAVSLNLSGTGNALTGMTVAVTTKNLGEIPTIHWRSRGK
ncbi:TPA: phage tail protein [Pseudomonas aeruginosa]|nr:phage tail protein [Pseudomonas aeruginosa]